MKFKFIYFCIIAFFLTISCDNGESEDPKIVVEEKLPKVSAVAIGQIATDEVIISATISGVDNTSTIEEYGFIYDNAAITTAGQGNRVSLALPAPLGKFESVLKNLTPSKSYFVRAYVVVKGETTLGDENTFTTKSNNSWFSYPFASTPELQGGEFRGIQLTVNGKGYIGFGGRENGGILTVPLYEYDPLTRKLTTLAKCPAPHSNYTRRFVVDNNIYLITSGNVMWRYSIAQNSWTQLNNFPAGVSPRHGFSYDGNGWLLAQNDSPMALELWTYNVAADSWTKKSTVDVGAALAHEAYGVTVINNKIYIIAAIHSQETKLYEYTPDTNTYKKLLTPAFTLPFGTITDTYMLTAAGVGYYVNMNAKEIWKYSDSQDSWTKIPSPEAPGYINLFAIDNNLYIASHDLLKYVVE